MRQVVYVYIVIFHLYNCFKLLEHIRGVALKECMNNKRQLLQ